MQHAGTPNDYRACHTKYFLNYRTTNVLVFRMQLLLMIGIEVYTLFQLWLVSASTNTKWKTILLYLTIGTISVTALTLTFHIITVHIIPYKINTFTINPIIEEVITILPIVLIARLSSLKRKLNVLDWMLLAAALGCGFQLAETGIRIVGTTQHWPHLDVSWPDIGRILTTWLPERINDSNMGYAGHGLAAALMGLGVGLWNKYRRWGVFAFVLTVAWCISDHSLNNLALGSWLARRAGVKFFWNITLQGKLLPWALTLGIATTSIIDLYHKGSLSRYRQTIAKWIDMFVTVFRLLSAPSTWQYLRSKPKRIYSSYLHNFRHKSYSHKAYAIIKTYFWLSFFFVFFLNGIIPKSIYKWYFQTPLWWSVGLIGHSIAIYVAWCWFKKWRSAGAPEPNDAHIVFLGRGILSISSMIFVMGSIVTLFLKLGGKNIYLRHFFLYQAAGTFLHFIRHGVPSLLGALNGLGGSVSGVFAPDAAAIPENSTHFYEGGSWNGNTSFDAELGQVVYIRVRNVNILGTTITIQANNSESMGLILLPQQERVFRFERFTAAPHDWHFDVSTNSDAFMVTYEVHSTWVPGMQPNR